MATIEIEAPPWGFCPECLARMQNGGEYKVVALGSTGASLMHGYCAHREVGAVLLIRPGRPKRWRIITPIEALDWVDYLCLLAPGYTGTLHAIRAVRETKH